MLETRKLTVIIGEDNFTVSQENWDTVMTIKRLEEDVARLPALDNMEHNLFRKYVYPKLSGAVVAGTFPTLEKALELYDSPEGIVLLDYWYKAVQTVEPTWLKATALCDAPTNKVVFSDGSELKIAGENWYHGIRLSYFEALATALPPYEDIAKQLFRVGFYPKLIAAITDGTPPTEEEARSMPSDQLNLWYEVVRALHPEWYILNALFEARPTAEEIEKKKKRLRKKS